MSEKHIYTAVKLVGFMLIAAFILAVIRGGANMVENNASIRENCVKTNLVVIGNKGHASPVYDCSK